MNRMAAMDAVRWRQCPVEAVLASCISAMLLSRSSSSVSVRVSSGNATFFGENRRTTRVRWRGQSVRARHGLDWCRSRRALVIGALAVSGIVSCPSLLEAAQASRIPERDNVLQPIQFDQLSPCTVVSAPGRRIVAVGDLHGDLERTQLALRLAGVLSSDGHNNWIGGSDVLVQVGDVLDRGNDEIVILSLLSRLRDQAQLHGGAVLQINGNHETMNVAGEFRDAVQGGFEECARFMNYCEEDHGGDYKSAFRDWFQDSLASKAHENAAINSWKAIWNTMRLQKGQNARAFLFSPGGPLALELANHGVVLKVNNWLFAHGGVLPHHVEYGLERINKELTDWMRAERMSAGKAAQMPFIATRGFDSIVWSRLYSREVYERPEDRITACAVLSAALSSVECRGLVVGHTPQVSGANCECDGRIWRIDVGMSSGVLHALPQILEIVDDQVRVLKGLAKMECEDVDDMAAVSNLGNLSSLLDLRGAPRV